MSVCSGRGKMSQKNVCRVDFGEIYVSVQNIPISTWIRFANYIIHILVYIRAGGEGEVTPISLLFIIKNYGSFRNFLSKVV